MAYSLGTIPSAAVRTTIQYKNREYELVRSQGHFRSVLYRNGKALSMAPPKACPIETFEEERPFSECIIEDWITGDSVNLFFDHEWEICTLDGVGGATMVESCDATLRQRFFEMCDLKLTALDTRKCYSFVMNTKLWLVACYEIDANNTARSVDSYGEFRGTSVQRPEHLIASTYEEARERFASYNCDASSVGVMIYHIPSGERSKLRNPVYDLANIDLKIQHRFFYMRSQDRTDEYLRHFPEHAETFKALENHVWQFIVQLHQNYINLYVKKGVPVAHRVHLHTIHQHYLRKLRPSPVTLYTVTNYVNQLNPVKLFYTMNPQISEKMEQNLI